MSNELSDNELRVSNDAFYKRREDKLRGLHHLGAVVDLVTHHSTVTCANDPLSSSTHSQSF